MFKHPVLKGKKASRKRRMSFNFVDDTPTEVALETVDLEQVDLIQSIEEVEFEHEAREDYNTVAEQDDGQTIASHKLTPSQESSLEGEHWENQIKSGTSDETNESFNY